MNKKNAAVFLSLIFLVSCRSLEKSAPPLVIYDARLVSGSVPGLEFSLVNAAGKDIQSASFFASVCRNGGSENAWADGEVYQKGFDFKSVIPAGEEEKIFIPFDEIADESDFEEWGIESLEVTGAVFEDETIWKLREPAS